MFGVGSKAELLVGRRRGGVVSFFRPLPVIYFRRREKMKMDYRVLIYNIVAGYVIGLIIALFIF